MNYSIQLSTVSQSKAASIDFDNIPLGSVFTDHMFICDYSDGSWHDPRIQPLAEIATHPAAMALHYGQAIFEGMKATLDLNGIPLLFRPEKNAARLNFSARRMGIPEFPETLFLNALQQLVALEKAWIPSKPGSALYLRPFIYADEAFIGMRAATSYKFIIVASPSNPIYSKPIRLLAETTYIRAAVGGTGQAKAAGNYAAAILPTELAKSGGYDQVLWLDAKEHKYIQEVGTMNIFFKINGEFITPSIDGAILDGITRMSVIDLLVDMGYKVTERPITIEELFNAYKSGSLEEVFGTGTAVAIAMVDSITYKGSKIDCANGHSVGLKVLKTLNEIRSAVIEDKFNWLIRVVG